VNVEVKSTLLAFTISYGLVILGVLLSCFAKESLDEGLDTGWRLRDEAKADYPY
jgi:hypothetical protein